MSLKALNLVSHSKRIRIDPSKGLNLSKFPSNSLKNWTVNEILGISTYLYLILQFFKRKEIYLLLFINKRWKFLILESNENPSINIKYFRTFYNSIYLTDNLLDTKSNNSYCFNGSGRIIVAMHKNQTLICDKIVIPYNGFCETDLQFRIFPFHCIKKKSKIKSIVAKSNHKNYVSFENFIILSSYSHRWMKNKIYHFKDEIDTKITWKVTDENVICNDVVRKQYQKWNDLLKFYDKFYFIIDFDCHCYGINCHCINIKKNCINISII